MLVDLLQLSYLLPFLSTLDESHLLTKRRTHLPPEIRSQGTPRPPFFLLADLPIKPQQHQQQPSDQGHHSRLLP